MTFGSLFAGIGGFDLGLAREGLTCLWQVEVDKDCTRVLARHWPEVRRYGDITTLDSAGLSPVDLLVGGFPCQDVSVAGRRAGLAGERSGLFFEFLRFVTTLRPRWILIENVPGLLSSNGTEDMGAVYWRLGELGFWWAYRSLDAQYFGVAQRRRRVFIVGHSGKRAAPVKVLFEPESGFRGSPPSREAGKIAPTIAASGAGTSRTGNERTEAGMLVVNALTPVRGGSDDNDAQAGHLVVGQGMTVRRLTPRECERLQGFPDDWTVVDAKGKTISDSARYRMLGNAVCVPVVEWLGRRILEVEGLP